MGTRGIMAFAIDNVIKVTYNQYDSYPDGLGLGMLNFCRRLHKDNDLFNEYAEKARRLRTVSDDATPTPGDFERYGHLRDSGVSTGSDWYALLRHTQGNPALALDAGVHQDSRPFAADSLFCEWGYVLDFDVRTLEVYEGFQHSRHDQGRFAHLQSRDTYYPIRLVKTYSLDDLPDDATFLSETDRGEDG